MSRSRLSLYCLLGFSRKDTRLFSLLVQRLIRLERIRTALADPKGKHQGWCLQNEPKEKTPVFQGSVFILPFQSPRCCEWQSGSIAPDGRLSVVLPGAATTRPRLTLAATNQATVEAHSFSYFSVAIQKSNLRISDEV